MRFTETSVSATEEKHIVTGLIVSSQFCKRIKDHLDSEYITNKYLRIVSEWCIAFFDEHNEAPFKHINTIFESFRHTVNEAEGEMIDELLTSIGNQYTGEDINVDFLCNEAEEYFRKRELEIHINNISVHKENGDLDAAEEEISRFNRISIKLDENIYINPGDPKTRDRIYKKRDEEQAQFFQLPGDLGLFMGNMKPTDVIGITAPAKRGKSWMLTDFQKHAVLSCIQVLKWSIEMTDTEELTRHDKAFFPSVDKESGIYAYPAFDCMRNQVGDCTERNSKVIVRESAKDPIQVIEGHVLCTKCRNDYQEHRRFIPTTYMVNIHREKGDRFCVKKGMKNWNDKLNKYSRIVVRPKYSLTYDMMMRDFDIMVSRYNFIPRILLLDYLDILQITSKFDDYRLDDEKWKLTQKIAGSTGCLFITPTQANKEGYKAETLHTTDQAGFYGKGRHCNSMFGINQKPDEKRMGLYRISMLDSRSSAQDNDDSCLVLQDLNAGQMHLDSYWAGKWKYKPR